MLVYKYFELKADIDQVLCNITNKPFVERVVLLFSLHVHPLQGYTYIIYRNLLYIALCYIKRIYSLGCIALLYMT